MHLHRDIGGRGCELDGRARRTPREEASREEGPEEEPAPRRRSDAQPESRNRTRSLNHAAEPNRVSRGMAHRADHASGQGEGADGMRDRLSTERRALPWVRVEKPYV